MDVNNNVDGNNNVIEGENVSKRPGVRNPSTFKGEYYDTFEKIPFLTSLMVYMGFSIIAFFGSFKYYLAMFNVQKCYAPVEYLPASFGPLYNHAMAVLGRNTLRRIWDCGFREICSAPAPMVDVIDRYTDDENWHFKYTGRKRRCVNMSSYNYMSFGQNKGPCADAALKSLDDYGIGICSPKKEVGTFHCHKTFEKGLAEYLQVDDALTFAMGYGTNVLNLAVLFKPNDLLLIDAMNHRSIFDGGRLSGASIVTFNHTPEALENVLREQIVNGNRVTGRPWSKICVLIEGIYSMEGSIVHLPAYVDLKKKYGFYLFMDEAHSIGAVGPNAGGVTDYFGVNPREVDILMGTLTKCFGAAGGYMAGSASLIRRLRKHSHAQCYASPMPAGCAMQSYAALEMILNRQPGDDCDKRMRRLAWNTRYFRRRLHRSGYIVHGSRDSPVVPVMLYYPGKWAAFARIMLERGIAAQVIIYPVVPMLGLLARFCISALHTKEQLDTCLDEMNKLSKLMGFQYSSYPPELLREVKYGREDEFDISDAVFETDSEPMNCNELVQVNIGQNW